MSAPKASVSCKALAAPVRALGEVIVQDRKNSWDSAGYLWVAGSTVVVLIVIVIAIVAESRHKRG